MDHSFLGQVPLHPQGHGQSYLTFTSVAPSAVEVRQRDERRREDERQRQRKLVELGYVTEQRARREPRRDQHTEPATSDNSAGTAEQHPAGSTGDSTHDTANPAEVIQPECEHTEELPPAERTSHTAQRPVTWRSDVTLQVEDRPVPANRGVLSTWSPVFAAMFSGGFAERTSRELPLPGKRFCDIEALVKVTHPERAAITSDTVEALLTLAQEYLMDELTARCETFLLTQPCHPHHLRLSERHHLPRLRRTRLEQVAGRPRHLVSGTQRPLEAVSERTAVELALNSATSFRELYRSLSAPSNE